MKIKSGAQIIGRVTSRQKYTQYTTIESEGACDLIQVEGLDSMLEVDGATLNVTGPIRFHGADWSAPRMLLRVSRDADGNSINHTHIHRAEFTGHAQMQYVNDGSEVSQVVNCRFENYAENSACLVYTNIDRPNLNDRTRRDRATNSGHEICGGSIGVWGKVAPMGRLTGACIRLRGCVTDVMIKNVWLSGNAPALVLIDDPDESWPGGGTFNRPARVVMDDCIVESDPVKQILTFGYPPLVRRESKLGVQYIDAGGSVYLELRGSSVENFHITQA